VTLLSNQVEVQRITRIVQAALDRRQPSGYRIEVQPDGVLQEDDWYHVVVRSNQDVRTYDFYDVLAETEAELQDEQKINVLLVPAVGD
jgi:hypothetical protein